MQGSARFQNGSLTRVKNKSREDSWFLRYYEMVGGRRVHRNKRLGGVSEFPTRKHAEVEANKERARINCGVFVPQTVLELVEHYKRVELNSGRKAFATVSAHACYLNGHIVPQWGVKRLSDVKAVEVELWLDAMEKAPGTRAKIRNVFSAVFAHGIRHEWLHRNPISHVRTSAKRLREPDVLPPAEFQALLAELTGAPRVMVFLAGATGMRRGELIALRWCDVDFLNSEIRIVRSCVRGRFGKLKTEASQKPLPLHAAAIRELSAWRAATSYAGDDDFLFPSLRKNGKQPLTPDMVLVKVVRPALKRAKVTGKVVGWHTFRHSLATNLRSLGVDVKVSQELMRHANSRITLDVYTHGVSAEKRAASERAVEALLGSSVPSGTVEGAM